MSLFSIGLSGLNTAQNALTTVGHNISNAATTGYSRQNTLIASAGAQPGAGGYYGQGSNTTSVVRVYSDFLNSQLRNAQGASAQLSTYSNQISQIDNLLGDQSGGLAPVMQSFFSAVQGVSNTPADPSARQALLNAGQSLAGQMRSVNNYFQQLQQGVNSQLQSSVTQVNAYAQQLAQLNTQITQATAAAGGQPPNDLLDQRDQVASQLTQLIGAKVVVQDGGVYNMTFGSGQALVMGSNAFSLKAVASAADPSSTTIAYTLPNGNSVEMDTSTITGGSIGGMLQYRSQTLNSAQNAIGRLSVTLGQAYNAQQALGVDLTGQTGGNLFKIGSPVAIGNTNNTGSAQVTATISNTANLTTSDYTLSYDGTNYNLVRASDNKTVATAAGAGATFPMTLSADGLNIQVSSAMSANDSFQIQPTRNVAGLMDMAITDPAKIAAAGPLRTTAAATNTGSGTATVTKVTSGFSMPASAITATYNGASYVFTDASGATVTPTSSAPNASGNGTDYTFNGITVTLGGTPKAKDSFTLTPNLAGVSDNTNALAMAKLQTAKTIGGISNFNDAFAQLVNDIGSKAKSISIASTSQDSITTQAQNAQQAVSGVNMDEETVSMMRFQQLYQANARVLQTASTLFDSILGIN
ncbi:flagellar hook-associated protein FlgK [Cupriavidus basilensis]|uniref:Flagellar hook-associated protein 1 n=1 Tax=Cupriavidus basilensis TaxID=68895 RepID=A0ABT6AP21_9BURK|nr:flagellar hook-associated protein FlgK [Cupriavidus basilensis]MDF3834367.1 flagellar hook-associated protein FlgK [Cupriavidus basilensis]